MKLNVKKIKKELKRLGWTYDDVAKRTGFKGRQNIFYYIDSESISGAEIFGKVFNIDPKDLII